MQSFWWISYYKIPANKALRYKFINDTIWTYVFGLFVQPKNFIMLIKYIYLVIGLPRPLPKGRHLCPAKGQRCRCPHGLQILSNVAPWAVAWTTEEWTPKRYQMMIPYCRLRCDRSRLLSVLLCFSLEPTAARPNSWSSEAAFFYHSLNNQT